MDKSSLSLSLSSLSESILLCIDFPLILLGVTNLQLVSHSNMSSTWPMPKTQLHPLSQLDLCKSIQ